MLLSAHRAFDCYLEIWWQDLIIFGLFPSFYTSISLFFKVFSLFCIVRTLCWWAEVRWFRICRSLIYSHYISFRFSTVTFIIINLNIHSRWLTQTLCWSKCLRLPLILSLFTSFLISYLDNWVFCRLLSWIELAHRFRLHIRSDFILCFLWAARFAFWLLVYHLCILLRFWSGFRVKTLTCLDSEPLIFTFFIIWVIFRFLRIESMQLCLIILVYCA